MGTNITGNIIGLDTAEQTTPAMKLTVSSHPTLPRPSSLTTRFRVMTVAAFDSRAPMKLLYRTIESVPISASDDVGNGGVQSINERFGLWLHATTNAVVGGTSASERNIISGNYGQGLLISDGSAFNMIQGNYLGVDGTGLLPIGNSRCNSHDWQHDRIQLYRRSI